jgi:hypothetical protein
MKNVAQNLRRRLQTIFITEPGSGPGRDRTSTVRSSTELRSPSGKSGGYVPAVVFCLSAIYLLLRVPTPAFLLSSNDQGYQMALATAVAAGDLPGFDFVTQYGPFVAFTSYLGLVLTGNATGEMLICAFGYSAAIAIVVSIVWKETGHVTAIVAFAAQLLLFSRYYKWYYWLFPLLGLVASRRYWNVSRQRGNEAALIMIGIWGQIVGISALFRYDLGLEGAVVGGAAIIVADLSPHRTARMSAVVVRVTLFLLASAILPTLYLTLIGVLRDAAQLWIFVRSMYSGAVDTVEFYGIPPFQIDLVHPRLQNLVLTVLQFIVPAVYATGMLMPLGRLLRDPPTFSAREYTLFCAAVTGLGIFPQAVHRGDIHHLLQVIPPFIITLGILCRDIFWNEHLYSRKAQVAGAAIAGLLLAALAIVLPGAAFDLGPLVRNPIRTWQTLAGLPGSLESNPVADMALAIRRLTPPRSTVFLVMAPSDMPLLYFANRHQPGLFPTYEPGMFSGRFWLERNQAILQRSPPDYLVVPTVGSNDVPAPFIPDLVDSWLRHYRLVLYANERYRLLAVSP